MGPEQAELPLSEGGIGCPDVVTELLALSAATVAKWAANSTRLEHHMGDTLMLLDGHATVYIAPGADEPARAISQLGWSLWTTGSRAVAALVHAHRGPGHVGPTIVPESTAMTAGDMAQSAHIVLGRAMTRAAAAGGTYTIALGSEDIAHLTNLLRTSRALLGTF